MVYSTPATESRHITSRHPRYVGLQPVTHNKGWGEALRGGTLKESSYQPTLPAMPPHDKLQPPYSQLPSVSATATSSRAALPQPRTLGLEDIRLDWRLARVGGRDPSQAAPPSLTPGWTQQLSWARDQAASPSLPPGWTQQLGMIPLKQPPPITAPGLDCLGAAGSRHSS